MPIARSKTQMPGTGRRLDRVPASTWNTEAELRLPMWPSEHQMTASTAQPVFDHIVRFATDHAE